MSVVNFYVKIVKKFGNVIVSGGGDNPQLYVEQVMFPTSSHNSPPINSVNDSVDSLSVKLRKEIKIEGLKSEKRAIQASDRKILDVNRQTEIDQEISKLDK